MSLRVIQVQVENHQPAFILLPLYYIVKHINTYILLPTAMPRILIY